MSVPGTDSRIASNADTTSIPPTDNELHPSSKEGLGLQSSEETESGVVSESRPESTHFESSSKVNGNQTCHDEVLETGNFFAEDASQSRGNGNDLRDKDTSRDTADSENKPHPNSISDSNNESALNERSKSRDLSDSSNDETKELSSKDASINSPNTVDPHPAKPVLYTQTSTESITGLDDSLGSSSSKPKKKRLTLQERLALAAKAKKKLQSLLPQAEPKELETPSSVPGTPVTEQAEGFITVSEPQLQPLLNEQKMQQEIQSLKDRISALSEENINLKQRNSRSQIEPTDWKRVAAEKDNTIKQLMEEGQALSKKELKLNERVRSLVQDNTALETSLLSYATKNEEISIKLQEIEDVMRTHKLKSVEQLLEHLEDNRRKLAEAQKNLTKERNANWEGKYKELQTLYEQELNSKKEALKQLNDSTLHLQMLENQTNLALQAKDKLIEQLNQQIILVKDESSLEISHLEGKIENLRLENESFLKMSQGDRASALEVESSSHKQIEYAEYSKLSSSHRDLQAQYVSSQENWKIIESNLQNKLLTMASSLDSLKKSKIKNVQEIRKLSTQLLEQTEAINNLEKAYGQTKADNDELHLQLNIKKGEYAELEEKLEELRTVFNSDRKNYDLRIQSLSETIAKYEEQEAEALSFQASSTDNLASIQSRRMGDSGLHINLGHPAMGRQFSYNSVSLMNTPAHIWDDRGDVSDIGDPRNQIDPRMSYSSIPENYLTFQNQNGPDYGDLMRSGTPVLPSFSSGNNNIQLINKMSSSIRRLEVELLSIKEENEELSRQKDEAQQEIVRKFELNHKVEELEKSITELTKELEQKSENEKTLLEVIGEKSERVSELQADVEDLKDLCRQQVQQMIEMAEKKG